MKGRVKSGLGLSIGADIEEEAATEETLMVEDDISKDIMEETAAEATGPPPVMVKLTARHYNVNFKDEDEFLPEKPKFDCKECNQQFDSRMKLKHHLTRIHNKEKDADIKDPISKSEKSKMSLRKSRKL